MRGGYNSVALIISFLYKLKLISYLFRRFAMASVYSYGAK